MSLTREPLLAFSFVAPAIVPDANRDGRINATDLKAYGVASDIVAVPFRISD